MTVHWNFDLSPADFDRLLDLRREFLRTLRHRDNPSLLLNAVEELISVADLSKLEWLISERTRYPETPPPEGYPDKLDDIGDLYTVEEYRQNVAQGGFIDYDGSGHPVKDGKMNSHICIKPSRPDRIPADATHIRWYNK